MGRDLDSKEVEHREYANNHSIMNGLNTQLSELREENANLRTENQELKDLVKRIKQLLK